MDGLLWAPGGSLAVVRGEPGGIGSLWNGARAGSMVGVMIVMR